MSLLPEPIKRAIKTTKFGKQLANSPLRRQHWDASLKAAKTLWFAYGHLNSVRSETALDAAGAPVPWYTYPAIEFLKQFDFSTRTVFEYGAGNSTLFWAQRAAYVVSVEDNDEWYEQLRTRVPPNCTLLHEPDLQRYATVVTRFPDRFDVMVIDGPARGLTRLKCAFASLKQLRPGGLIILDNSDWLPESARVLREADLLQVDFSGFAPIVAGTQTTSFFFHRECRLVPRTGRQPLPSAGAKLVDWEAHPPIKGSCLEWDDEIMTNVVRNELVEKMTSHGTVRHFRVVVGKRGGRSYVAILDVDLKRVLLGPYEIRRGRDATEEEIDRIQKRSWNEFAAFVREHEKRRYLLEPVATNSVDRP
jgi:hypothetical protein